MYRFEIPKEYYAQTGTAKNQKWLSVPSNDLWKARQELADTFGIPVDTVERLPWSAATGKGSQAAITKTDALAKLERKSKLALRTREEFRDPRIYGQTATITEEAKAASQAADKKSEAARFRKLAADKKTAAAADVTSETARFDAVAAAQQAEDIEDYWLQQEALKEQFKRESAASVPRVAGESFAEKSARERQEQGIGEFGPTSQSAVGAWTPEMFSPFQTGNAEYQQAQFEAAQARRLRSPEQAGSLRMADESSAGSGLLEQMWGTVPGETDSFAFQPAGGDFESWTPEKFEEVRGTAGFDPDADIDPNLDKTFRGERTVDEIIAMFGKKSDLGDHSFTDDETGIEIINPLLAQLIDLADMQKGRVSMADIEAAHDTAAKEIAEFNRDAAKATAEAQGASDVDVAKIMADADKYSAGMQRRASDKIATERRESDEYIARQQLAGTRATAGGVALAAQHQRDAARDAAASQAGATTAAAESARLGQQAAATSQADAITAAAYSTRLGQEAAARSAAGGVTGAAESARLGQEAAAKTAAGAASPFGFLQQGGTEADLGSVYAQLNQVGLAEAAARESQAQAANLAARGNAFGFAAGQAAFDPNQVAQIAANTAAGLTGSAQVEASQIQANAQQSIAQIQANVNLDQNTKEYQIAQISDQAQRAVAAIQRGGQISAAEAAASGQIGAARAGASGFGALLEGGVDVNRQANEILRAQAANNPYAIQQLGRGWSDTAAADQNLRIDQILRGGLTPQQRIAEINASQAGQNFANQLNFMSNPSAIGFATEQGLLNDINNSPEGNLPGSLFGFNSPSAAGAGGGQTTNTGNFNINTLRNASDEQIGFLQGAAAAGGQTPSEFQAGAESFTPEGY